MSWEQHDLDDIELGERASFWLLRDEVAAVYSRLEDRAWLAVLGCYAKVVTAFRESLGCPQAPGAGLAAVAAWRHDLDAWKPALDEHGMWHMPPDQEKAA